MQSDTNPARWFTALLRVHVAATVCVLGATLVLLVLGIAGLGAADAQTIYPAVHAVGAWLVAPLAGLSLISGVFLAMLANWRPRTQLWMTLRLVTIVGLTGKVVFGLVPCLGAMANTITEPTSPSVTSDVWVPLVVVPAVASTLFIFALLVAVFRPIERLRSWRSEEPPGQPGDTAAAPSPGAFG
jgi:hypothetical protein